MRVVRSATWTCVEPVSAESRPCFWMISCLASLVRDKYNLPVDDPAIPARREGRTRTAEITVASRVAAMAATALETLSALEERAGDELERTGVPGVAFGVSIGGEKAVGAAGDAAPEQSFRVASVTKPFVAALVLTLVQDGLVSLDEPVTRYLPELRLPAGPVTLRQLLSHQAGLEHEWSTPLADYGDGDDALERLARGKPLAAPTAPGEWFSYASAGYYVAAAATAHVTG